jgi:hypothetical protein
MKAKRKAIRETWGHFALMNDVRMMFFAGQTGEQEQQYIDDENLTYGDITQGNFTDHYDNLTIKTVSMLQWVKDYCPQVRSFSICVVYYVFFLLTYIKYFSSSYLRSLKYRGATYTRRLANFSGKYNMLVSSLD